MRTETTQPPAVPLEAGIGPANPPCPACGEPLFGWTTSRALPVRRCEACSLGAVGEPGDEEDALAALERGRAAETPEGVRYRIANRSGLAAWIGGRGWTAIEPGTRYLFSPEAVRRLAAGRDQELVAPRWLAGPSITAMWGTLLNAFTFGHNVGPGALGRATATPAPRRWQRALDVFIAVATAPVLMLVAPLLESAAALARRGGVVELTLRVA